VRGRPKSPHGALPLRRHTARYEDRRLFVHMPPTCQALLATAPYEFAHRDDRCRPARSIPEPGLVHFLRRTIPLFFVWERRDASNCAGCTNNSCDRPDHQLLATPSRPQYPCLSADVSILHPPCANSPHRPQIETDLSSDPRLPIHCSLLLPYSQSSAPAYDPTMYGQPRHPQ